MSTDKPPQRMVPPSMPVAAAPVVTAAPAPAAGPRVSRLQLCCGVACGILILLFAVLSRSAILSKGATYDEPLHAVAGYTNLRLGDYRLNFEDPPIWHYWVAIPNSTNSIKFNHEDPAWVGISNNTYNEWDLSTRVLYQTDGNEGIGFINRSRFMMLILAVALAALLACCAWRLAGPVAAVIATTLFCLDPTLIAHGSIIKNDVAMALIMLATFALAWQIGKRLTLLNAAAIALIIAIGVNTKFSAILLGPMLVALLAVRVAMPWPWVVLGRKLSTIAGKSLASVALLASIAVVSYIAIWASYSFRFTPSRDESVTLNTLQHVTEAVKYRFQATHDAVPEARFDPDRPLLSYLDELASLTNAIDGAIRQGSAALPTAQLEPPNQMEVANYLRQGAERIGWYRQIQQAARDGAFQSLTPEAQLNVRTNVYKNVEEAKNVLYQIQYDTYLAQVGDVAPDRMVSIVRSFLNHRLLPSAWLHGILFVHARSIVRSSFLMGETSPTGFLSYFPLAMLFKSPVATVLSMLAALSAGIWLIGKKRMEWMSFIWPLACIAIPFFIYMTSAITSRLNIGIRHLIPAYPFMYLAAGIALAAAARRLGKPAWITLGSVGIMLLVETAAAFPNYIAYFSFPFGGPAGGFKLLSDSNLDWGQDLPLLRKWQQENPNLPLAFGPVFDSGGSYFGRADPKYYGINAVPAIIRRLPIKEPPTLNPEITKTHIFAVSATLAQETYGGEARAFTRGKKPFAILGGTIYLYDLRETK